MDIVHVYQNTRRHIPEDSSLQPVLYFVIDFVTSFSPPGATDPVGLHIIESSRSHSGIPHSVGLLRTSERPDAQTST